MKLRRATLLVGFLTLGFVLALSGCDIDIWLDWLTPEAYLTFSAEWDYYEGDVDLHLTFLDDVDATPLDTSPTFDDPYTYWEIGDFDRYSAIDGFWPEDDNAFGDRKEVSWERDKSAATTSGFASVELTRDIRTGDDGPEVIIVRGFPFRSDATDTWTVDNPDVQGLKAGFDYVWVGTMELYAYALPPSDKLSNLDGSDMNVVISVYNQYDDKIAEFRVPEFTDVRGASIARINCFYRDDVEFYQVVPDVRVINETAQIRGLSDSGIVVATGRTR